MHYDVLIVGAGPAGLAAAIRLKQQAAQKNMELSVCVLEKGAEVGSHILSGAVLDPSALNELLPDWKPHGAPLQTEVTADEFYFYTARRALKFPGWALPPLMTNHGNYIISLGDLCKWLGQQAEELGVEIYAGFNASDLLYNENNRVLGVITGDMGVSQSGKPGPGYTPGIEIRAKYTLVAEGTRGSLTKQLEQKFDLRKHASSQKYGLGFKEVWRIQPEHHRKGLVQHSLGWPLDSNTGGGSFVYHYGDHLVSLGFVVHLDYENPHLSPYDEFQQFKTHPHIRQLLQGGSRLSYGARAISEGGVQSMPELIFPGGALLGCSAGMVNLPRIKGNHNAMKSGMLAADAVIDSLLKDQGTSDLLLAYPAALRQSSIWQDLYPVRNAKPMLSRFGTVLGTALTGLELWLQRLGVSLPWTLQHMQPDHACTRPASEMPEKQYPKPDGVYTFDRLNSINLSNIAHESNQPCHLQLSDTSTPIRINLKTFDAPEQRYCPAGVYEIVIENRAPRLQINAQNCIHCKTCDIKDPTQNINWVPPEGGSGPNYLSM